MTARPSSLSICRFPAARSKFIVPTATGNEPYRLVGTIVNGPQGTFVDRTADDERSFTQLASSFWDDEVTIDTKRRSYVASLKNVSAIRPAD